MKTHASHHHFWMNTALEAAQKAAEIGEVPVGAVIVKDDQIIALAHNTREQERTPMGHAELNAIQIACRSLNRWRLHDCSLYVTLEPCIMCAGALIQCRIPQVYFGAADPKGGAMGSLYEIHRDPRLNHRIDVQSGIYSEEAGMLLKNFFASRRHK